MEGSRLRKGDGIPFTQVANAVLNDATLSWKAKGLYAYLYGKPDGYRFSSDRIAKDGLGGRFGVLTGLRELEKAGYVTRNRKPNGDVEYAIWIDPATHGKPCESGCSDPQCNNCTVQKLHDAKTAPINNMEIIKTKSIRNKHPLPPTAHGFEAFWEAYPRKVNKRGTIRAWGKATKGMDSDQIVAILDALDAQRRGAQWQKDGGQFIPHPTTWLNQERWNDRVEVHAAVTAEARSEAEEQFYKERGFYPPR